MAKKDFFFYGEMKPVSTEYGTAEKDFFFDDVMKPSSVLDRHYIWYNCKSDTDENDAIGNSDESSGEGTSVTENTKGKWMLFLDSKQPNGEGMTQLDIAWQLIKFLVDDHENTGIISVGSTTGLDGGRPRDPTKPDGALVCFTKDYRNKRDVKRAADSIRRVVDYTENMFYKTKITSDAGLYTCLGHRTVSIYKHTPRNRMYERDHNNMWIPATDESGNFL